MLLVITVIRSQNQEIKRALSTYNEIFIDESIVSAVHMRQYFADYGLVCKDLEQLRERAKVLDLQVWGEDDSLL